MDVSCKVCLNLQYKNKGILKIIGDNWYDNWRPGNNFNNSIRTRKNKWFCKVASIVEQCITNLFKIFLYYFYNAGVPTKCGF